MILERLKCSREKQVAVAMSLICAGLVLVVLNILWTRIGWLSSHMGAGSNWGDFACGFAVGLGVALEVFGVVLAMAAQRYKSSRS